MTSIRIRCCVPHCAHTLGQRKGDAEPLTPSTQWICRNHWMAIPKRMRMVHSRAWNWQHDKPYRRKGSPLMRDNDEVSWRIWRRCKRAAIERAAGL
jgi:hypothetical protein